MKVISPYDFLTQDAGVITKLIDVRTPKEFDEGHIVSATNLPLFTDEERAIIGTIYKHQGKQEAILRGLEFVGPKMPELVQSVLKKADTSRVTLYCWRGGMRSRSVGFLLETIGIEVQLVQGGYKAMRQVMRLFIHQTPWKLVLLGGHTGSGKTLLLRRLKEMGEQVIDLEQLAHHKGSAFGWIGEPEQPTTAQFFNELYHVLKHLNPEKPIWVEAESNNIGKVRIPECFWAHMVRAPRIDILVPEIIRLEHLVESYGRYNITDLARAFSSIQKRLGGKSVTEALAALDEGDLHRAASLALRYYDKSYEYAKTKAPNPLIARIECKEGWKKLDLSALLQPVKLYYNA